MSWLSQVSTLGGHDRLEAPNLPIAAAATSIQNVNYWIVWLPWGQESMTLQNWVWKAKTQELEREIDLLLPVGFMVGRMAPGSHGDAELGES